MTKRAIFVVRHAPVAVAGVCYGQSDVPTELTAKEASAVIIDQLGDRGASIGRVWASPARRASDPAAVIASALRAPLEIDPRLAELAFGEWEGLAYADLEANDVRFAAWMADWRHQAPPGGERLADLVSRVSAWRRDAIARNESALVVTHAGVIRALRAVARRVSYDAVVAETVVPLRIERIDG